MITEDDLVAWAPRLIPIAVALAVLLGGAWLFGVHKQSTMIEAKHAREAYAAVKIAAGPRMQVRKIQINQDRMSVLAVDPDMPAWRYVPGSGRAGHPGHWYYAPNVYEQSWRVSYWTVFGRDWYHVEGPEVEGIIQEREGTPFDLRPEQFTDFAELFRNAVPDPALPNSLCARPLVVAALLWTVCLDNQGDPLLVFVQAK
jgi:hypothetical protein